MKTIKLKRNQEGQMVLSIGDELSVTLGDQELEQLETLVLNYFGDMTLDSYQEQAAETNTYKNNTLGTSGIFMGLSGEAGEATDKAKKEIRDHEDTAFMDENRNTKIIFELGDTLWYVSQAARRLGYSLTDVAHLNLVKVLSRAERDKIHGEGDDR